MEATVSNTLSEHIKNLDEAIFRRPATISIMEVHPVCETVCAEFICEQNPFLRLFIKDKYVVYRSGLERYCTTLTTQEFIDHYLMTTACHEVRHRFQTHNPKCVLPVDFFTEHQHHSLIGSVIRDTERRGYESEYIRSLELDANFISQLVSLNYRNNEISLREIVTGNREALGALVKKLGFEPLI